MPYCFQNDGSLINKNLIVLNPEEFTSLIKVGDIIFRAMQWSINDEPLNPLELPYFDQSVKVFKTDSN